MRGLIHPGRFFPFPRDQQPDDGQYLTDQHHAKGVAVRDAVAAAGDKLPVDQQSDAPLENERADKLASDAALAAA